MKKLPVEFLKQITEIVGRETDNFLAALDQNTPTSIRVNDKQDTIDIEGTQVPWCDKGLYLDKRPLFTADPFIHGGAYYVQEASSMFLAQVVQQCFPEAQTVLDLCAAPGGKSTLLRQYLPDESLLVSNEIIRSRSYILAENLVKWGNKNCIITNNRPQDFASFPGLFDVIVIDAPCSGEGMFRKDPDSVNEWSLQQTQVCAQRQTEIIADVWDALRENGLLVYSTCTYNYSENEDRIREMLDEYEAEKVDLDVSAFPEITITDYGYRFYPHKTKGEGFFISIVRKCAKPPRPSKQKSSKTNVFQKFNAAELPFALNKSDEFDYFIIENQVKAFSKIWTEIHQAFEIRMNCIENGLILAEKKGKDLIPSYQSALSKCLDRHSVQIINLNYENAISFLKKENIILSDESTGYLTVAYKGLILGWVKNLGNRCNNLYPSHWKIKMNL